jgi:serine protease Do
MRCFSLLLGLLLPCAPLLAAVVILDSGAEVRAPVVQETADRVVLDLGHDVLSLPRRLVREVRTEDTNATPVDTPALVEGLYRSVSGGPERAVQEHVRRLGEAVVEIRTPTGLGSGFLVHPDGYLVTNHHVIAGETKLTVTVFKNDGTSLNKTPYRHIRIVALDAHRDLALLKIDDADRAAFTTVPLDDTGDVRPGRQPARPGSHRLAGHRQPARPPARRWAGAHADHGADQPRQLRRPPV